VYGGWFGVLAVRVESLGALGALGALICSMKGQPGGLLGFFGPLQSDVLKLTIFCKSGVFRAWRGFLEKSCTLCEGCLFLLKGGVLIPCVGVWVGKGAFSAPALSRTGPEVRGAREAGGDARPTDAREAGGDARPTDARPGGPGYPGPGYPR